MNILVIRPMLRITTSVCYIKAADRKTTNQYSRYCTLYNYHYFGVKKKKKVLTTVWGIWRHLDLERVDYEYGAGRAMEKQEDD